VFSPWSAIGHINYKISFSPTQNQYQITNLISILAIPDKVSVYTLMKAAYDD
jgi:hypothetical protein